MVFSWGEKTFTEDLSPSGWPEGVSVGQFGIFCSCSLLVFITD